MNKFKEQPKKEKPKIQSPKRQNKVARSFVSLFSGSFLSSEEIIRQLPFLLFLAFISLLYIGNGYYAEKTVRRINTVTTELKELHSQYIITSSELMYVSKQSEVSKMASSIGIKESLVPPKKIVARRTKPVTH
jgi:hypothetical protein